MREGGRGRSLSKLATLSSILNRGSLWVPSYILQNSIRLPITSGEWGECDCPRDASQNGVGEAMIEGVFLQISGQGKTKADSWSDERESERGRRKGGRKAARNMRQMPRLCSARRITARSRRG